MTNRAGLQIRLVWCVSRLQRCASASFATTTPASGCRGIQGMQITHLCWYMTLRTLQCNSILLPREIGISVFGSKPVLVATPSCSKLCRQPAADLHSGRPRPSAARKRTQSRGKIVSRAASEVSRTARHIGAFMKHFQHLSCF